MAKNRRKTAFFAQKTSFLPIFPNTYWPFLSHCAVTTLNGREQFIEDCEDVMRLLDEKLQRDGYYLLHI